MDFTETLIISILAPLIGTAIVQIVVFVYKFGVLETKITELERRIDRL